MTAIGIVGHFALGLSFVESFLLAELLGAASPAVVVPRMARTLKQRQLTKEGIPEMIIPLAISSYLWPS